MATGNFGQILALLGLVLLLVNSWGRQRSRRRPPAPGVSRWQRFSAFAAYALILMGLLLMWAQK
jgi:cytochrome b561